MTTMERRPDSRGKVRDIYDAGENLLMVATDRISAFDLFSPTRFRLRERCSTASRILVR